jgi:hypothetical protein
MPEFYKEFNLTDKRSSAGELGARLYKNLLVIYANFSYIISMTVELLTLNQS